MLSSIIKDEINENLSEYDLETYYNKYIDYDSFFEILSDYGFFGDEISDNEDIGDVEMKD